MANNEQKKKPASDLSGPADGSISINDCLKEIGLCLNTWYPSISLGDEQKEVDARRRLFDFYQKAKSNTGVS